jgi:hypothetical protein
MELSDEQKQRILLEEQARLAEERYREQVRLELNNQPSTIHVPSRTLKYALGALAAGVILCAVTFISLHLRSAPNSKSRTPSADSRYTEFLKAILAVPKSEITSPEETLAKPEAQIQKINTKIADVRRVLAKRRTSEQSRLADLWPCLEMMPCF